MGAACWAVHGLERGARLLVALLEGRPGGDPAMVAPAGLRTGGRSSHQEGVVGLVLQGEENRDLPWCCCWSGWLQGGSAMGRERGCAADEGRRLD